MKTILYATDYSPNSVGALRLAQLLAKNFDAQLIVMHVFEVPVLLASPVSMAYLNKEKRLIVEHKANLKRFCSVHLGLSMEGIAMNYVVVENGSVWNGILEKATKLEADLIVVGSKGANPIKEFFLGSTTKALIQKASSSVLAVPADFKAFDFKTFVYASDFELADILAIKRLAKIAKMFNAQIKIVHITTKKEYEGDRQVQWLKEMLRQKVSYEKIKFDLVFSEAVIEALNKYLNDSEADLLAMLERSDSSVFRKPFHKDVVLKMEEVMTLPLLSFNVGGL